MFIYLYLYNICIYYQMIINNNLIIQQKKTSLVIEYSRQFSVPLFSPTLYFILLERRTKRYIDDYTRCLDVPTFYFSINKK